MLTNNVNNTLDIIKTKIEKELEIAAYQVFSRHFDEQLCNRNFDFRKKTKNYDLEDVGDYDVLLYIPEKNIWVMAECKFNQTPFCMKDMKRLKETIFGNHKKSHLPKIMKRYEFLKHNHQKIAEFLGYHIISDKPPIIKNLYIAKSINWVHRGYSMNSNIEFLQLDNLDYWITECLL